MVIVWRGRKEGKWSPVEVELKAQVWQKYLPVETIDFKMVLGRGEWRAGTLDVCCMPSVSFHDKLIPIKPENGKQAQLTHTVGPIPKDDFSPTYAGIISDKSNINSISKMPAWLCKIAIFKTNQDTLQLFVLQLITNS